MCIRVHVLRLCVCLPALLQVSTEVIPAAHPLLYCPPATAHLLLPTCYCHGRWATPFSHLVRYARKHLVELGDVVLVPPEAAVAAGGDGGGTSGSSGKEFTVPEGKRRADQV